MHHKDKCALRKGLDQAKRTIVIIIIINIIIIFFPRPQALGLQTWKLRLYVVSDATQGFYVCSCTMVNDSTNDSMWPL